MRLKNIIWKTVVMSLMASPLCISCDDDDEVTVNSKFYLSTKVFPVDSYEASLSVILKDNSVVVNELQPNYRFVACATERLSKDVKITADSDDNLVSAYNKANDTEYNILPAENYSFTNKTVTIENGESVSGDSIKIELLNVGSLTTEGGYLLPVTISSIEGYREGCHKTCPQWRLFQEKQRAQRQAKKQYLQFYNALCAQVVRQCRAIEYRRIAW